MLSPNHISLYGHDVRTPFAGTKEAARLAGNPIFEHLVASVSERRNARLVELLENAEVAGKRAALRALLLSNSHARRLFWSRKSAERDRISACGETMPQEDDSLPYDISPSPADADVPAWYVAAQERIGLARANTI